MCEPLDLKVHMKSWFAKADICVWNSLQNTFIFVSLYSTDEASKIKVETI